MFHYEKDKSELMAEEECDKAVAEIIKVAERIAEATDTRFERHIGTWSIYNWWKSSDFDLVDGHAVFWHSKYDYHDVHIDVSDLVYSEAIEFAWAAESLLNERASIWRRAEAVMGALDNRLESILAAIDCEDLWDQLNDALDANVSDAFDKLDDLMEDWIVSAEDWYTSMDFIDELKAEMAP